MIIKRYQQILSFFILNITPDPTLTDPNPTHNHKPHANWGCRSPSTESIACRRTRYDRTNSRNEANGTASQASSTFSFKSSGFAGHPSSLSRIHRTIQDHTTSMRLRSGELGGHAGSRFNSRVCLVNCARWSCSRR